MCHIIIHVTEIFAVFKIGKHFEYCENKMLVKEKTVYSSQSIHIDGLVGRHATTVMYPHHSITLRWQYYHNPQNTRE